MITSRGYDGRDWVLVEKESGRIVEMEEEFESRGITFHLTGGSAPHRANSSGRVYLHSNEKKRRGFAEFFPHVIGLEWAPIVSEAEA